MKLNEPLTRRKLLELLSKDPEISEIEIPEWAYKRSSKAVLRALEKVGVSVKIVKRRRGRPRKVEYKKVIELLAKGLSPAEIAEVLGISERTVYRVKSNASASR